MSFFNSGAAAKAQEQKDFEVSDPPGDSISSVGWSSAGEYLAVGSWDNNVRIYEVNAQMGQTQGKAMYSHQGPVLSLCWNKEGNKVISGGADNAARMYDLQTGQTTQVAQHDAPIKSVKWIETPQGGILATGSWDKTLKYWDLRSSAPVSSVTLPERCYTMDVVYPLMVVGTAERHIQIYNLTNPTTVFKAVISPLKYQTRVVSCFPTADGYAVGSVEGRVAIQYLEEKQNAQNFSFKCHRADKAPNVKDQVNVFAVNDISFHPIQGTFSTVGSDGTINFWDKESRTRLKTFDSVNAPITTTAFNRTGNIFAYAISYDWSKGHGGMITNHPNKIMIHSCTAEEITRKTKNR